MDKEEEEEATAGVGGAVHSDDWKYSCVGIVSAPVSDEKRVWWHQMRECKRKSLWCVGMVWLKKTMSTWGMSCAHAMSIPHAQLADRGKHAPP